ncbi:MAG: thiamine pyrophosphate-dependent enzyme [bacterium]
MKFFDFYRKDRWPHMFCPGCGIGTVMHCFFRAFDASGLDQDKTIFVSGIGCSGRIPGYIRADSLHTTHGRPIPFAGGIKLANPDLKVVIFTGDGDLGAIGGNHFINGCRRNIDLTVICINNYIYGMTGGQASTTTPCGYYSSTTPYGNKEYPFDLSEIAVAAGANYVARWTTYHIKALTKSIEKALLKDGFSFVEIASQCPTQFGRRNEMHTAKQLFEWLKQNSIPRKEAHTLSEDIFDLNIMGKITVGEFVERNREAYTKVLGIRK